LGFDYRYDLEPDFGVTGIYTTEVVTAAVQAWIKSKVSAASASAAAASASASTVKSMQNTFAFVAHEAVHGPLEAPMHFIDGPCRALVPADYPSRLAYCGMVRAMDESVGNITKTYKELGLWDDTLVILSADNGGNVGDGGNNFPLRGNKATTWEGGVRGLGFVSGAGLSATVRGTVSHQIFHVTDWFPTLVQGIASLDLDPATDSRPCPTCTRAVAPLDGVNQWAAISTGVRCSGFGIPLHSRMHSDPNAHLPVLGLGDCNLHSRMRSDPKACHV
jgi:hypothetical protein